MKKANSKECVMSYQVRNRVERLLVTIMAERTGFDEADITPSERAIAVDLIRSLGWVNRLHAAFQEPIPLTRPPTGR